MTQGAWTLIAVLALASAFGCYRAARDGRFRGTHTVKGAAPEAAEAPSPATETGGSRATDTQTASHASVLDGTDIHHELGERATLLQFSSAFCAPCRATRRVLADVATLVPGVQHVEIDAEHHLELVRRLRITRTPTTLILDSAGQEVSRATGAPRKEAVLATLGKALEV